MRVPVINNSARENIPFHRSKGADDDVSKPATIEIRFAWNESAKQ
jgi:hypothetical protein